LEVPRRPGLYLAWQMAGVEGYVESAALGLLAALNVVFESHGRAPMLPDAATAHGALIHHLSDADPRDFQPMNVNFGLFPPLDGESRRIRRREKSEKLAARALDALVPYQRATAELLE
ncbi:MAG: FAD-dependent oxidoreductase, partial [Myxococcota bacterium]